MKEDELLQLVNGTHNIYKSGAESVKVQRSNTIIRLLAQIAYNTLPEPQ